MVAGENLIVAGVAIEAVMTSSADDGVVVVAAVDFVVACPAVDQIVARASTNGGETRGIDEDIGSRAAVNENGLSSEDVEIIAPSATEQRQRGNRRVRISEKERVIERRAIDDLEIIGAGISLVRA